MEVIVRNIIYSILLVVACAAVVVTGSRFIKSTPASVDASTQAVSSPAVWFYEKPEETARFGKSDWLDSTAALSIATLSETPADILIVPFQTDKLAFDATTRSLLTLTTANAIVSRTNLSVADPLLVANALGAGRSAFTRQEIEALATKIGAKRILLANISHGNGRTYTLRAALFKKIAEDARKDNPESYSTQFVLADSLSRADISFSDENLPYNTYQSYRDELIEQLLDVKLTAITSAREAWSQLLLEDTVDAFIQPEDTNLLSAARRLQLMAALHPITITERYGRQLYERSLVLLESIDESSPNHTLMQARAFLALNRRFEAVTLLESLPASPARNSLFEYANGNIQKHEELLKIEDPLLRLAAIIENQRLRYQYYLNPEDANFGKGYPQLWAGLISAAYLDDHIWKGDSNHLIKTTLDHAYPIADLALPAVVQRQTIAGGEVNQQMIARYVLEHLDAIETSQAEDGLGPRPHDFLDLTRSTLVEGIHDEIRLELAVRGRPDVAKQYINDYNDILAGQADFQFIQSQTLINLIDNHRVPTHQRDKYAKQATTLASHAVYQSGVTSPRAVLFKRHLHNSNGEFSRKMAWDFYHSGRWPYNWDRTGTEGAVPGQYRQCLKNTIHDFSCFRLQLLKMWKHNEVAARRLIKENEHRFRGHKERLNFLYSQYKRTGDHEGVIKLEQELKNIGYSDWALLTRIADVARLDSRFKEATDIILQYPEFQNQKNSSAIQITGNSFNYGSHLYWAGAHESATKLYQIAASNRTGANSEMTAQARLATINRDYQQAAAVHLERIRRYQSANGMRDLIGLATLIGDGASGLQLVEMLKDHLRTPHVWTGALIAHRANKNDREDLAQWAQKNIVDSRGAIDAKLALRFLFMAQTTDRTPTPDLAGFLDEKNTTGMRKIDLFKRSGLEDSVDWGYPDVDWSATTTHKIELTLEQPQIAAARAMHLLYAGEYTSAYNDLQMSGLCGANIAEYLWVCAWSAATAGASGTMLPQLERYVARKSESNDAFTNTQGLLFDQRLALALLYGFNDRAEDAIKLLKLANADHRYTDHRNFFSRYLILEIGRILFKHSSDSRYSDLVLGLARRFTVIDPAASYNHSFIAELSSDRNERISSLAYLLKMDPESRSVNSADPSERESAEQLRQPGAIIMQRSSGLDGI